jgi:hypothetical protein
MTKLAVQTDEAEAALRRWGEQMRKQAEACHQEAAEHEQKAEAAKADGDKFQALYSQSQEALANLASHKAGKKAK